MSAVTFGAKFKLIQALLAAKLKLPTLVHFGVAFALCYVHTAYGVLPITWLSARAAAITMAAMPVNHVGATAESHHEIKEDGKQ